MKKVDSSVKNEKAQNLTNSQAEVFADDFASFQGSGKGVTLAVMTADTAAESSKTSEAVQGEAEAGFFSKSAAKTTLKLVIFIFAIILIISIAKNVDLWLKYNRLQDVYIDTLARHTGWERSYILEAMKYSLDKVKPNIKEQRESGQIDLLPYKERSLNKEFENLNKEIEKDIEHKLDKIEQLGGGVNE